MTSAIAHIATQIDPHAGHRGDHCWPLTNGGLQSHAASSINGITYAGQSNVCLLTNRQRHDPAAVAMRRRTSTRAIHKPTWTLALDHDLWDGTMVYATMRSGYRSGGINTQAHQYRRH